MKKSVTAIAVAATLVLATLAVPQQAEARGGRVAAGIIGGLAVGTLLGMAAANGGYYYDPPRYYYRPRCEWRYERYWNGWRWRSHRVRVCD